MKTIVCLLTFLCLTMSMGPARASADDPIDDLGEAARAAVEHLLGAVTDLVDAIPQYEAPEILDNGDIIIRRKRPPAERKCPPDCSEDDTI